MVQNISQRGEIPYPNYSCIIMGTSSNSSVLCVYMLSSCDFLNFSIMENLYVVDKISVLVRHHSCVVYRPRVLYKVVHVQLFLVILVQGR